MGYNPQNTEQDIIKLQEELNKAFYNNNKIKFEDIVESEIAEDIGLNYSDEESFWKYINTTDEYCFPIYLNQCIQIKDISKLIVWLKRIQIYYEQNKEKWSKIDILTKEEAENKLKELYGRDFIIKD